MLFDDIAVKARTLLDAQNAGDAANHAADHAANNGADRAGSPFALPGASLNAPRNALGLRDDGKRHAWRQGRPFR